MTPLKVVLLLGKDEKTLDEIRQSISADYQVVVFEEPEKAMRWHEPFAIVLHQNGSPLPEVQGQLARLREFQPRTPIAVCASLRGEYAPLPLPGADACILWPEGCAKLRALLRQWERGTAWLWGWLQQAFARLVRGRRPALPQLLESHPAVLEPATLPSGLAARFFGSFELAADGARLPWINSEINRAMLAYMLFHQPERILRHKIIGCFWPESTEDSARNCLNVAVSNLRRYLKDNLPEAPELPFRENAYRLDFKQPFFSDVHEFQRLWKHAHSMERQGRPDEALHAYYQAARLYRGDFMESITRDIPWVESMRSEFKEKYLVMLDRLSELLLERQRYQEAAEACLRILKIDDCLESAHCRLMRCYWRSKRKDLALRQYQACCKALERGLESGPSKETQALLAEILG